MHVDAALTLEARTTTGLHVGGPICCRSVMQLDAGYRVLLFTDPHASHNRVTLLICAGCLQGSCIMTCMQVTLSGHMWRCNHLRQVSDADHSYGAALLIGLLAYC